MHVAVAAEIDNRTVGAIVPRLGSAEAVENRYSQLQWQAANNEMQHQCAELAWKVLVLALIRPGPGCESILIHREHPTTAVQPSPIAACCCVMLLRCTGCAVAGGGGDEIVRGAKLAHQGSVDALESWTASNKPGPGTSPEACTACTAGRRNKKSPALVRARS